MIVKHSFNYSCFTFHYKQCKVRRCSILVATLLCIYFLENIKILKEVKDTTTIKIENFQHFTIRFTFNSTINSMKYIGEITITISIRKMIKIVY